MARMTASDFVTIGRERLGGPSTSAISNATMLRYLNEEQNLLVADYKFTEFEDSENVTTADGTSEYELTGTDILVITDVIDDTKGYRLQKIDRHEYERITQGSTTQDGDPLCWFESGVGGNSRKQITFWPEPDGVNTVRVLYLIEPTELVLTPSATSPVLPRPWDSVLMERMMSRCWRHLGNPQAARDCDEQARDMARQAYGLLGKSMETPIAFGGAWSA